MITSLREGMNLSCHEYVVCQDGKHTNKKYGPAVLSEFTGSSSIFGGNELAVNPWDYRKCAEAIKVALEMDAAEKERRYLKMREVVMRRTAENWLTSLTTHLAEVHDEQYKSDTMTVPRLAFPQLFEKYKKASQRLFLFGYEGALTPFGSVTQTVLLSPQQVTDVLADLMADERNIVYVMSGRTLSELELIFGRNHGIGLIAENGCFLREAGTDEWITFADQERTAKWMEAVKSILQYYVERVEGSWIEERLCSLVFHYPACGANASADGDGVADRRAGDCANHINDACEQQRVRAVPTKGCVVVEPIDWDKSTAAAYIVRELTHGETVPLDFLFVAGNGRDDEVVFHWAQGPRDRGLVADVTTVSIGRRNTAAVASLPQGSRGASATTFPLSGSPLTGVSPDAAHRPAQLHPEARPGGRASLSHAARGLAPPLVARWLRRNGNRREGPGTSNLLSGFFLFFVIGPSTRLSMHVHLRETDCARCASASYRP